MSLSPKMKALAFLPRPVRRKVVARHFTREVNVFGERELGLLRRFVRRGDLALDIGCNVGSYAFELARLTGNVTAFEPNPALVKLVKSYGFPGLRVEAVALSSSNGTAELTVPAGGGHALGSLKGELFRGQNTETVTVPTRTLDRFGFGKVRFIKIDVEGFEEEVLAGAAETLRASKPVLLIEIEERHNPGGLARIRETLGALGYKGLYLADGQLKPLETLDTAANERALGEAGSVSRRASHYVNNFLFLADEDQRLGVA